MGVSDDKDKNAPNINDQAMKFGQLYRSSLVCGVNDELPSTFKPDRWNSQSGTRTLQIWVSKNHLIYSNLVDNCLKKINFGAQLQHN